MYYYDMGEFQIVGASPGDPGAPGAPATPEGERVTIRPIAGTRPRGATPEARQGARSRAAGRPKERAEHVMLIDLASQRRRPHRADRQRQVTEAFVIERYSHVMHIVSNVEGAAQARA